MKYCRSLQGCFLRLWVKVAMLISGEAISVSAVPQFCHCPIANEFRLQLIKLNSNQMTYRAQCEETHRLSLNGYDTPALFSSATITSLGLVYCVSWITNQMKCHVWYFYELWIRKDASHKISHAVIVSYIVSICTLHRALGSNRLILMHYTWD